MIDYEEMFRGAMQARAMVANPDQWADSDRDQVNTRHYLSTSMRVALDRGEFFLVYQPIIRLADNRIIGAEALLRWEHPTLGTLLPGRFIDRAENNGLMVPLTAFVLEQACRHVRSWRDHSTDPQPFVSVNVSASTICDPGFLVLVEGVLGETGLPAHALQLELAEDARLSRDEKAVGRPIFHGLLGDIDADKLCGLTTKDKVPHVLNILDCQELSARCAASMIEVDQTLWGWPQLAGDIWVGAATVAEAVRRIGLGEPLESGRVRVDVSAALDRLDQPPMPSRGNGWLLESVPPTAPAEPQPTSEIVAQAAIRAPSGGNVQPWHVVAKQHSLTIRLAPEHTSAMDIAFRGSAVAVGAAMFNARVAAAAHRVLGSVEFDESQPDSPLQATMHFGRGDDPSLAALYRPMLLRTTNRHHGMPGHVHPATVELLTNTAAAEGARLQLLLSRNEIDRAATILAAADRIRYLTPRLHEEMMSELRWPGDPSLDAGIDVRSLELDSGELRVLDILRRSDVVARLAQWDCGTALEDNTNERVSASSALAIVYVDGATLTDFARGGSAMQAVWIVAQQHGLAVQPMSPIFLYARGRHDLDQASPHFAAQLHRLQLDFRELVKPGKEGHEVLIFRLFHAPPPSVCSRRRVRHAIPEPHR
ncbi:molybdopterin biosynthesis protein MoeY [Mycobacterium tuberculosis]|nr:molybdopterin biosynthesis protein MoeY [Mycobacterium tuberculosis]CNV84870.1 molybdopterin biosynthesis protein MoeY [Mycobacterium tuberculosis]